MVLNSDGNAVSKETPNGVPVPAKGGAPMGKIGSSMQSAPQKPNFDTKEEEREYVKFRLAQAFRIFADLGFDDGVAGHITARDPIHPDAFWVNPFGVHFSLITPDLLLLVDHHGEMLAESGPIRNLNRAAFMIHSALHVARPDVMCAAHTHSMYGRAFSTLGRKLDIITQNDCTFYEDHALYDQFNGLVIDEEEGQRIAETVGPTNKSVILQNHGLITMTGSIEGTISLFKLLEETCQCQLLAYSAAAGMGIKPVQVSKEEAEQTHKLLSTEYGLWFNGLTYFQVLEHKEQGKFGVWNGPSAEMKSVKK